MGDVNENFAASDIFLCSLWRHRLAAQTTFERPFAASCPFGRWTVGRGVTKGNSPPETTGHKNQVSAPKHGLPAAARAVISASYFKACAEGRCRCEAGHKGNRGRAPKDQQHPARTDMLF